MEALRIELEDSNIGTSVYLPGGVNTNIRLSENYRPQALRNATPSQAIAVPPLPVPGAPPPQGTPPSGMDPLDAGQCVIEGVRNNDLFIFSHPEFRAGMQERFESVLASVPIGRTVPQERLALERVTMRVPLYAAESARLQSNPRK